MSATPTIIYTKTDEAPALATYSLLPIVQAFAKHSGIAVETLVLRIDGNASPTFDVSCTAPGVSNGTFASAKKGAI